MCVFLTVGFREKGKNNRHPILAANADIGQYPFNAQRSMSHHIITVPVPVLGPLPPAPQRSVQRGCSPAP